MFEVKIVSEPTDVDVRLKALGVTSAELSEIALNATTARNDSVANDPINAPGTFAYIYGTRSLRETLQLKSGWEIDRTDGIESVVNQDLDIKIVYQNVDSSCGSSPPKAISGKGKAAQRLIENATMFLFHEMEEEYLRSENTQVWFLCVAINGDDFKVELSRPRCIEGGQFSEFVERIFIQSDSDFSIVEDQSIDPDQEFEISVTRKK